MGKPAINHRVHTIFRQACGCLKKSSNIVARMTIFRATFIVHLDLLNLHFFGFSVVFFYKNEKLSKFEYLKFQTEFPFGIWLMMNGIPLRSFFCHAHTWMNNLMHSFQKYERYMISSVLNTHSPLKSTWEI